MENIHIVFGHSAAATLRQTLKSAGNSEQVFNCWGDYQAGPLGTSLENRLDWLCNYFYDVDPDAEGAELRSDYVDRYEEFRELTTNTGVLKTIWFSKASSKEYCGYCEFLFQSDAEYDLIHGVELSSTLSKKYTRWPICTGTLSPEDFKNFLPLRRQISRKEIHADLVMWKERRNENTALRILSSEGLCSVAIDFFDKAMLSFVTESFQSAARVIGNTLGYVDNGDNYIQGNTDLFYFSRLRELHRQGAIEWEGSLYFMREARVRLLN